MGIVSLPASALKGTTLTHLPCVLSAAVCVVIGWQQKCCFVGGFFLFHQGMTGASRLGTVLSADVGRGDARRHLRHNLHSTGQPLSPCKKKNNTVAKLELRVCMSACAQLTESIWNLGIGICLAWSREKPTHYFLQILFPSFQHFYIQHILYVPARSLTKTRMVVMLKIRGLAAL